MSWTSLPQATQATRAHGPAFSGLVLVAFLAISFAVAALGTVSTIQNVNGWYADAAKAVWTPPNLVFGPVWTVLYTLISVSAWLVWLYPAIGISALWIALAIIATMDVMVLVTMLRFWPVRRAAALLLLLPYWAWVMYATTLNVVIAVQNR